MCGRFELKADKEYVEKIITTRGRKKVNPDYDPNIVLKTENIAPTDNIIVIVRKDDEYRLKIMKWAIRSKVYDPSKQKLPEPERYIERDIFNSRIETIKKSYDWKQLFNNNRCIIPMTAFYEWIPVQGKKIPQRIFIDEEDLFFAGGIYTPGDLRNETGASIITCDPNVFMKPVHNRMPVLFESTELAFNFLTSPKEAAIEMCQPLDNNIKLEMQPAMI
jgi:putative SOS response-associated peptidase YedK